MKHIINYVYILLLLLPYSLLGQINIKGTVINSSGNPIQMADIVLLNNKNTILKGASSNEKGEFLINYDKNGDFRLKILHIEYQSKSIQIDKTIDLGNIPLKPNDVTRLDEIVITASTGISLKRDKGKFVANVENTSFQNSNNVLDGLRQIPLIEIDNNNNIKVTDKTSIIEINGIRIHMSSEDLSDYLKSLDSQTIKKIEINPTPNASYGSDVDAVINIITNSKLNNYRIGLKFNNGLRSKYYHNEKLYFYLNTETINIYSNYTYKNSSRINKSVINNRIFDTIQKLNYIENNYQNKHNLTLNFGINVNKKNRIDLTQVYGFGKVKLDGKSINNSFRKDIMSDSKNRTFQLAQVWKNTINDSTSIKLGFYEVFKKFEKNIFTNTNNSNNLVQNIKTKIPILIGFADYSFSNKIGDISLGLKYNRTKVNDDNRSFFNKQNHLYPYSYKEKILSFYVNQQINLNKDKKLSLGVRTESSLIDYYFYNTDLNKKIEDSKKYTNILYNVNYESALSSKWYNTISYRKKITRPNYKYLNPFKSVNSDITLFSGNININPQIQHSLSYQIINRKYAFFTSTGIIKDFISTINDLDNNNKIVQTYRNFNNILYSSMGAYLKHFFFNKKWKNTNMFKLSYFTIKDSSYKQKIDKSTPSINFRSNNNIELVKETYLNVNYNLNPKFFDGLVTHYLSHRLDINLSKRIGNFYLSLFAKDILKSDRVYEKTSFNDFEYISDYYNDTRLFGLSLKWSISGKAYKNRHIKKLEDDSIDRLK